MLSLFLQVGQKTGVIIKINNEAWWEKNRYKGEKYVENICVIAPGHKLRWKTKNEKKMSANIWAGRKNGSPPLSSPCRNHPSFAKRLVNFYILQTKWKWYPSPSHRVHIKNNIYMHLPKDLPQIYQEYKLKADFIRNLQIPQKKTTHHPHPLLLV